MCSAYNACFGLPHPFIANFLRTFCYVKHTITGKLHSPVIRLVGGMLASCLLIVVAVAAAAASPVSLLLTKKMVTYSPTLERYNISLSGVADVRPL